MIQHDEISLPLEFAPQLGVSLSTMYPLRMFPVMLILMVVEDYSIDRSQSLFECEKYVQYDWKEISILLVILQWKLRLNYNLVSKKKSEDGWNIVFAFTARFCANAHPLGVVQSLIKAQCSS